MERVGEVEAEIRRAAAFVQPFMPEGWPFEAIRFDVSTPIWLRQAVRLADEAGNFTGLLTWAFLDEPLHRQFLGGAERILHAPEWNEGLNAWLIHGYYAGARPPAAFRRKLGELVETFGAVHWLWDDGVRLRLCSAQGGRRRVARTVLEPAFG